MKNKWNLIQIYLSYAVLMLVATSEAQPVIKIAAGGTHSLFLKSDGSLWATGSNQYGQLGDGTFSPPYETNRPELIVSGGVTAIAAGASHSLFLKSNGSLWAMGYNSSGELGDGTKNNMNLPEQILASNVTAIAAGENYSLFLKSDGSLWGMGFNENGQLGDGTYGGIYGYTNQPEQIVASNVTAIAAGGFHSLFIKSDGSLWAMGFNYYGQLGDGNFNYETNYPQKIVSGGVVAISAGSAHSLFLKGDGSLWAMGNNDEGQLGDGTYNNYDIPKQILSSGVKTIAAGTDFSLFLKNDGSLWAMGYDWYGQLGDGNYETYTDRPELIVANNVAGIAAGGGQSLFFKSDGSLWAMGYNYNGQLGDGSYDYYDTFPVTGEIDRPEQIIGNDFQYTASPTNGLVPLTVQFTSSSTDGGGTPITHWNWNFGDGSTSTAQNPSHIYSTIGNFSPSLIVTNNLGAMVLSYGPSITASLPTVQFISSLTNGANQTGRILVNTTNGYTFTANAGDSVFLRLGTTNFDGELQLYGPNGSLLSTTAGLVLTDINISGALPSNGTYTVLVTSESSGGAGTYVLRLAQAPEPFVVPSGDEGGALTGAQHYQGKITLADMDMWSFTAFKGDYINLELNTTNFNGLFQLYKPDGALLVTSASLTNTDLIISGGVQNSGVYTALVTSQFSGGTGTYGLTVNGLSNGPKISSPVISGTNLMFNGVGGTSNGMFILYSTTNLAGIWAPISTNYFDQFGVFDATNTFNPALQKQGYYRFQLP